MSPAVELRPPVIALATLRCRERNFLVTATDPLVLLAPSGLWRYVYQTSAPYVNLGTATVLYSCLVPEVETPLTGFESHQIREDQKATEVTALVC